MNAKLGKEKVFSQVGGHYAFLNISNENSSKLCHQQ